MYERSVQPVCPQLESIRFETTEFETIGFETGSAPRTGPRLVAVKKHAHLPAPEPMPEDDDDEDGARRPGSGGGGNIDPEEDEGWSEDDEDDEEEAAARTSVSLSHAGVLLGETRVSCYNAGLRCHIDVLTVACRR